MLTVLARAWYRPGHPLGLLLAPLGLLYGLAARARAALYRYGLLPSSGVQVPVVVVGNVTVGGTGKTPLVLWLAERLRQAGWHPGIATRGYGGRAVGALRRIDAGDDPLDVGDEPLLLAIRSGLPVVAAPERVSAARHLVSACGCDVVVCDDGLQHLRLRRDVELAVLDGVRRLGNGRCLPAGPLREPASRLARVDAIVVNGGEPHAGEVPMRLVPGAAVPLNGDDAPRPLASFAGTPVHAVAGIGNPDRFFRMLRAARLVVREHAFDDHHRFTPADLAFDDTEPVLMTEKDAVKCHGFAPRGTWFVPVSAALPDDFAHHVLQLLDRPPHGPKAA